MALGVGKDLKNTDGIRFLMVETITAINRCKMLVDPKTVEHRAAEMDWFVGQYGEFAIREPIEGFADAGIQHGVIQHVRSIVREKHLQSRLNVGLRRMGSERPPD